jgi:NTE family protein
VQTRTQRLREEPFTLCLSAGFFGFFAHTGMIAELEARQLRPARIIGSSAGALAGGLWAMGLSASQLEERVVSVRREDFWDPGLPVFGLLRGRAFGRLLDDFLAEVGREQLEQAPTPVTIMVWELLRRRGRAIDSGSASQAIRAACALPVMFQPVRVDGRWCIDGAVSDREATSALRVDERALLCSLPHQSRWPEFGVDNRVPESRRRWRFMPRDLPRVTPFHLDQGPRAMHVARSQFAAWLDAPAGERELG